MLDQLLAPDVKSLLEEGKFEDILDFFKESHPTEIAEVLTGLKPEEALEILRHFDDQTFADVFRELPTAFQVDTSELLDKKDLAKLIMQLDPDDRVDLLKAIPQERFESVMPILAQRERENIKQLAQYAEGTAGSIMTTQYIALNQDLTVREALERIRLEGSEAKTVYTIFAVDKDRKLKGTVSLGELILAAPSKKLSEIMDSQVQSVYALNDREDAVYKFSRYDLVALPVVDSDEVLVGIITHDDVIDVIEQERTEDIERFMAITGKHENTAYLHTSIWTHFKHRVGWLIILAVMGLISGAVLQSFQETLTSLMILAFYMPMLADTGGNTGSQSATVIVRALALKEIMPGDAFKVLWKELRVALLLGLVLAALAFIRVLFTGNHVPMPGTINILDIGTAIAIALGIQVVSATIIGALLPLGAAALGADPALIASPALTTIVDITGLLIYFTTARMILHI
ncbi:MAG: magnesium transporter [Spirochaetia bacterium]|nr:magnesium transporter [Spirochaetia bacterium]